MKLIDIKDTLPVGFIPIQETVDTRKRRPYLLSFIYSGLLQLFQPERCSCIFQIIFWYASL